MQVYTQLGVCVSYPTSTRLIKMLSASYSDEAIEWKNHAEQSEEHPYAQYILVGDNVDKNVSPRDMRIDNQVKSLHYFHSYVVHDRIDFRNFSNEGTVGEILSLPLSAFVPSLHDCATLRENYIIHMARVITDKLLYFHKLKGCVVKHNQHPYSQEMSRRSTVVCKVKQLLCPFYIQCNVMHVPLGIIPKNEAKRKELIEIMELLHDYVPSSSDFNSIIPVRASAHLFFVISISSVFYCGWGLEEIN